MRSIILAVIAMLPSVAIAGEVDEAHRDAVVGRDSYWNCLAQEYNRDNTNALTGERDGIGKTSGHFGCTCRGSRAGVGVLLRADRTNQQTCKADQGRAAGRTGPAARQGSGGPRGAAIGGFPRGAPCGRRGSRLSNAQRRRRCVIAPALGRPLNRSAAPDVRAPPVRGRWHFRACFAPL